MEQARTAIERVKKGRPAKSFIMLGLRGVGKTVLLNEFEQIAEVRRLSDRDVRDRSRSLAGGADRTAIASHPAPARPASSASATRCRMRSRRAALVCQRVQSADRGSLEFGLSSQPATGDLTIDLTDLFVAIGEAADKRDTAAVILIGRNCNTSRRPIFPRSSWRCTKSRNDNCRFMFFGGGLPQLAQLAGDAKSYAERLFDYPPIGPLMTSKARGLPYRRPRRGRRSPFQGRARLHRRSNRALPVLPASVGRDIAGRRRRRSPITLADAKTASKNAIAALDEGISKVRLARLTDRQRAYARVMAEFGAEPVNSSDVRARARALTQPGGADPR